MMDRFICIHGHFYQPPRENPGLEAIEVQDEAYPYHDWNERITSECYATNATSRILDKDGYIIRIVNNYAMISFDFGPTLLSWLKVKAPEVYGAVLEADRQSRQRFSGHGSALAQAYNHQIMPLASFRDKETQIRWGIRDFERRFGRSPEGMWLPETAVDLETLALMVENGIKFTILAPHQARRVRPLGQDKWTEVSRAGIDTTRAYRLRLPSGGEISLIFYHNQLSKAVAFTDLLSNGDLFAQRLLEACPPDGSRAQLVQVATDGETYGHHHRFGDMALAYALDRIESEKLAHLTNCSEFLAKNPAQDEVEIIESTSWSCPHGVERWRADCGCNSGLHPQWRQDWRGPLRGALDWLRARLDAVFEDKAAGWLKDPWAARNDYIEVILDRSPQTLDRFLASQAKDRLSKLEVVQTLNLLEIERQAMLMYTSCGWFFDDVAGIETVQVLSHASRAIQLANEFLDHSLETEFLERLKKVRSNKPELGDGKEVYLRLAKPSLVDLPKVAANYAVGSLFDGLAKQTRIYCFSVDKEDYRLSQAGQIKLVLGRLRVVSEITGESARLQFGVLHLGDHNFSCGIERFLNQEDYLALIDDLSRPFKRADLSEMILRLNQRFGSSIYPLKLLFKDQQRQIMDRILASTLAEAEAIYGGLYKNHTPLMRTLKNLSVPPPRALSLSAELFLNSSLRRSFFEARLNPDLIRSLLEEARLSSIDLDGESLGYALRQTLEGLGRRLLEQPQDLERLRAFEEAISLIGELPFPVDLWTVQNIYYRLGTGLLPEIRTKAEGNDKPAREWIDRFLRLGQALKVRIGKGG